MARGGRRRWGALVALLCGLGAGPAADAQIAVAWNDPAGLEGRLQRLGLDAPFGFDSAALAIGRNATLRSAAGRVYALGRDDGSLVVVDGASWLIEGSHSLGAGEFVDIAVVDAGRAYVARRNATRLLRVDLPGGTASESVDLAPLLAVGEQARLGMLAVFEGHLFVQIEPLPPAAALVETPPLLAVVDLASESLVDVDPLAQGTQGIALAGTFGKRKMQIVPFQRRLYLSASGAFFDAGGIEAIDLDALTSLGLLLAEADGEVGADLDTFALVTPQRGYLLFSTDLLTSSHLWRFTLAGNTIPPELHTELSYRVPALVHDPGRGYLYVPEGGGVAAGMHVFDVDTGVRLTRDPVAAGAPTDIARICSGFESCDTPLSLPLPSLGPRATRGLALLLGGLGLVATTWRLRPNFAPVSDRLRAE